MSRLCIWVVGLDENREGGLLYKSDCGETFIDQYIGIIGVEYIYCPKCGGIIEVRNGDIRKKG